MKEAKDEAAAKGEKKRAKKERKQKRKRALDDKESTEKDEAKPVEEKADANEETIEESKESKKDRNKRRLERDALLEKVPKTDEHGIAYTKQQIRRMRKRVARGLDPLETPAEKHARLVRDAELRKEEEAELAGLMIQKERPENSDNDVEHVGDHDDSEGDKEEEQEDDKDVYSYEKTPKDASETLAEHPPRKKKKRSKPVPTDYVCSACENAVGPPHWIYDCPNKKTVPGTNQVTRKQRGLHNPSDTKLFVSGLPFDATAKDVIAIFQSKGNVAVSHCKLIKFEDTGRCKGQAFLTFDTVDAAKKALRMSGTLIENPAPPLPDPKKKQDKAEQSKRKEQLKLKVTKVLNRFLTKHNK
jgi:RNA recognition motif. (a.k.a. RRM, RBD, or RNP domain)